MALTACTSITEPSATPIPIKVLERPVIPPVAAELLVVHERPDRLNHGSTEALLTHSINYGAWCVQQDEQLRAWQNWYKNQKK